jgi:putative endonuclease
MPPRKRTRQGSGFTTFWSWLTRRFSKGRVGERAAAALLREEGYTLIEMNWRCSRGEIDIVAREGGILCFVEVKRRLTADRGRPEEAFTDKKRRKIETLAAAYCKAHRLPDQPQRIDMVAVDDSGGTREIRLYRGV